MVVYTIKLYEFAAAERKKLKIFTFSKCGCGKYEPGLKGFHYGLDAAEEADSKKV